MPSSPPSRATLKDSAKPSSLQEHMPSSHFNGASMLLTTPPSSRTLPHQRPGKRHFWTNNKQPLDHSLLTSQEQRLTEPELSSPAGPCTSASHTTLRIRTSVVPWKKKRKSLLSASPTGASMCWNQPLTTGCRETAMPTAGQLPSCIAC